MNVSVAPMGRPPKLKNIPLGLQEVAMKAAQVALRVWYTHGHNHANTIIPPIPGWQTQIGVRNGFVMLTTLVHGRLRPTILVLDIEQSPTGRLSYRQLHQQIRADLCLESKHSLRLCSFKPWYRYMQTSFPIPEHHALPATDAQCTHLLGTTLLYWSYVHLTDGAMRWTSGEHVKTEASAVDHTAEVKTELQREV